jgi:hypothetical protein
MSHKSFVVILCTRKNNENIFGRFSELCIFNSIVSLAKYLFDLMRSC